MVLAYNTGKAGVDLSDVITAYSSPLRKTVKWYRKIAIDLLLKNSVVNAYILYVQVTGNKIGVVEFRKEIVKFLCCSSSANPITMVTPKRKCHELSEVQGHKHKIWRYCKSCYEANMKNEGCIVAKNKTKKVTTQCKECEGTPFLCLLCFNKLHT
ncbi:uncharacterized protein [Diabrotica undecimpunctata]|uniref:uncharacterized protein n=1 Tax=Diabrotica undecimpunctata TaxID=50387 RepID=UPI003B637209